MRVFIIFFFCILTFSLNAQIKSSFINGFYIDANGNKHTGVIKNETVAELNKGIVFKETNSSKEEIKKADEINYVELETTETYTRFQIKAPNESTYKFILARHLLIAKLSLYEFFDEDEQIFLAKKDTVQYVLKEDQQLGTENLKLKKYYFKQLLAAMVSDCDGIDRDCENLIFSEKQILEIVRKYNSCKNSNMVEARKVSSLKTTVKQLVLYVGTMKSGIKKDFIADLSYKLYFPKVSNNVSLNFGSNYIANISKFNDNSYVDKVQYIDAVSLQLLIQYNLLNKNIRPYIIAGVSYVALYSGRYYTYPNYVPIANYNVVKGVASYPTYGIGLEANLLKRLVIKSEYKVDFVSHLPTIGLAYNFLSK